jgi:hypothetical protein
MGAHFSVQTLQVCWLGETQGTIKNTNLEFKVDVCTRYLGRQFYMHYKPKLTPFKILASFFSECFK